MMSLRRFVVVAAASCTLGLALAALGCDGGGGAGYSDSNDTSTGSSSGGGGGGGTNGSGNGGSSGSFGSSSGGGSSTCGTSISGTVYDPAGKNPLYGVAVYVAGAAPAPIASGATCGSCQDLYTGKPVASAITDAQGHFKITGVPDGKSANLVVQIGKWRKQMQVPLTSCQDNALADRTVTLPKNHGEGDIPNIAIATGQADSLECLLRRVGVDASEYVPGPGGEGRIHIFQGSGWTAGPGPNTSPGAPDPFDALFNSSSQLMPYDMVLLSCFGDEPGPAWGMSDSNRQALFDYTSKGGRVFASHFHYAWFNSGPFASANLASWSTGANSIGDVGAQISTTLPNGAPFPKGAAMHDWLDHVGALQNGALPIQAARHNADVSAANASSTPWIVAQSGATQYFSFDTPVGAAPQNQCGRVVFSDLHVGAASGDYGGNPGNAQTPSGCANNDLSPQEKALEFMLFDLSACVTPTSQPPEPPAPVK